MRAGAPDAVDEKPAGPAVPLLDRLSSGDAHASDELLPLVYDELRRLARRHLGRESPGHTLSATGLVHEVYLRLIRQRRMSAVDRDGFLAVAGATMRRILVDHARSRRRLKRGGKDRPAPLDPHVEPPLLTAASYCATPCR